MAKRNQGTRGGSRSSNTILDKARERPATTAAAAAGAVAAGAFLWSKRAQIGEIAGQIGDQIGEWAERNREFETVGGDAELSSADTTEAEGTSAGTTRRNKSSSDSLADTNPGRT